MTTKDLAYRLQCVLTQWDADPAGVNMADVNAVLGQPADTHTTLDTALHGKLLLIAQFVKKLNETWDMVQQELLQREEQHLHFLTKQEQCLERFVRQTNQEYQRLSDLKALHQERRDKYAQFFERQEQLLAKEEQERQLFRVKTQRDLQALKELENDIPKLVTANCTQDVITKSWSVLASMPSMTTSSS